MDEMTDGARVAAVDCGTNSIRLLIADVVSDGDGVRLRDVHREMRVVRLGEGVDATGEFAPEAMLRTEAALSDYADLIRGHSAAKVRMVATSAARDTSNRDEFFAMTARLLGAVVPGAIAEVIDGTEEAALSFRGAVGELDSAAAPFVVVDLGGGSTEVVVGGAGLPATSGGGAGLPATSGGGAGLPATSGGGAGLPATSGRSQHVTASFSANIGCVRLTERCLHSDPPTASEIAAARTVVRAGLSEALAVVPVEAARTWVGVAGTMTTLSALAQGMTTYDSDAIHLSRVAIDDLLAVCGDLVAMTVVQRLALGPMHAGRADVIGGGAILVEELARELRERAGIEELVVSEHDILDGIALSIV
jgi:exopolyphosphatase / guanosine-5'-triphosphate,3'-diphosphate pyrophosphatase